jgi:Arc/MetJ family transcription regulator
VPIECSKACTEVSPEISFVQMLISSGGRTVARTVIDLDDELVSSVAKELGTSTKKDTVNAALREVLANRRRAVALTRLRDAATDGAFDLAVLQDKQRYRR